MTFNNDDIERLAKEYADRADRCIREVYERAAPFRRVPPPESIAHDLLRHIQSNVCFMCQCRSDRKLERECRLIEDHDHETGMVRALLCRRCNTREGSAEDKPWPTYRQFAPANGWYYRYGGWGAQWQGGDPDPLPWRMKFSTPPGFADVANDPDLCLASYLEAVDTLHPTTIPVTCQRRFEYDKPQLLPGERYKTNEEMRASSTGGWPIISGDDNGQPRSEVHAVIRLDEARLQIVRQAQESSLRHFQSFFSTQKKP